MAISSNRESGYTLVELMVSLTLSAILVIIVFQMVVQAQDMADTMWQRIRFNQEARQVFELTANGAFVDFPPLGTLNAAVPEERISGIRGGNDLNFPIANQINYRNIYWNGTADSQATVALATNFNRLRLMDGRAPAGPWASSSAFMKLQCTGANTPHAQCTGAGEVDIGAFYNGGVNNGFHISNLQDSFNGRKYYVNLRFQMVDPDFMIENTLYNDPNPATPATRYSAVPWSRKESYRTGFFLAGDQ